MRPLLLFALPALSLIAPLACRPIEQHHHADAGEASSCAPETAPPASASAAAAGAVYTEASQAGFWSSEQRAPDRPEDARKKPFDIETLYRLKYPSSPQWSPDGSRILFTVTSYDLPKGTSNIDIYTVAADGSGLRQLTQSDKPDTSPRWSPDGMSFVFVSARDDDDQLWLMPIDGGEPRQLTHLSTGVDSPTWSPDGKLIAFASSVFPELGADDAKTKALLDDIKKSPFKAHVAEHLLFRHWTSYADGRTSHILVMDVASGKVMDVTPGEFEAPAFELGGGVGFSFSPDSKELCYTSSHEPADDQAFTTNKDLFVVPATGGKAVNITQANKAADSHPLYSPDGKWIAYLRQEQPGYESDRFRLALYDRKAGTSTVLTEGFDNWVTDFEWSSDSRSIVFQAAVQGRFPLYRVSVPDGRIDRVRGIVSTAAFDLSSKQQVTFTASTVDDPPELYASDPGGPKSRRITAFNQAVADEVDIRPVEEMWIPGADGTPVDTFIVKPHGFAKGKKYPLILNVHGGPQYQWADSFRGDWQVYPGAGYVVAFPNPHGSIGYGQAYTLAISKDWGGKVYEDVMKVTDALGRLDYVDADKMGVMGWSYGGYMMDWLLGHTDRFKAVASMMGVYDLRSFWGSTEELWFPEWDIGGTPWQDPDAYHKWSPSSYAANFKTPTLVITGEKDYRVPYTQSIQLFTTLRRRGVPSRIVVFPNDGHWPNTVKSMPIYYAAHLDWFHRYLGGKESSLDVDKMVRGQQFKQ